MSTDLPFFPHDTTIIKTQFNNIDLRYIRDLDVDSHHTTEDVGWALGKAINDALGDKKGIKIHFSCFLDECLTRCCVDISGHGWFGMFYQMYQ